MQEVDVGAEKVTYEASEDSSKPALRVKTVTDYKVPYLDLEDIVVRLWAAPDSARLFHEEQGLVNHISQFAATPLAQSLFAGEPLPSIKIKGVILRVGDTFELKNGEKRLLIDIQHGKSHETYLLSQELQVIGAHSLVLLKDTSVLDVASDFAHLIFLTTAPTSRARHYRCVTSRSAAGEDTPYIHRTLIGSIRVNREGRLYFIRLFADGFEARTSRPYSLTAVYIQFIDIHIQRQSYNENVIPVIFLPPGADYARALAPLRATLQRLQRGISVYDAYHHAYHPLRFQLALALFDQMMLCKFRSHGGPNCTLMCGRCNKSKGSKSQPSTIADFKTPVDEYPLFKSSAQVEAVIKNFLRDAQEQDEISTSSHEAARRKLAIRTADCQETIRREPSASVFLLGGIPGFDPILHSHADPDHYIFYGVCKKLLRHCYESLSAGDRQEVDMRLEAAPCPRGLSAFTFKFTQRLGTNFSMRLFSKLMLYAFFIFSDLVTTDLFGLIVMFFEVVTYAYSRSKDAEFFRAKVPMVQQFIEEMTRVIPSSKLSILHQLEDLFVHGLPSVTDIRYLQCSTFEARNKSIKTMIPYSSVHGMERSLLRFENLRMTIRYLAYGARGAWGANGVFKAGPLLRTSAASIIPLDAARNTASTHLSTDADDNEQLWPTVPVPC
jgi:hypothetical protein